MAKQVKVKKWSRKKLTALGIPAVLIPGLMLAIVLGWRPGVLTKSANYYQNTRIFPKSGIAQKVVDGDTFELQNGTTVRLIGINAPGRGDVGNKEATQKLDALVIDIKIYLEYDRYQDDKYGRILAWVWVGCEGEPEFLPPDYMHLTYNTSRLGLIENPQGCTQGTLVNEELVKSGLAEFAVYKDRGELKYEKRINRFN